ncbi:hypothetical protein M0805_006125 [Coniferiporia weirii]|nr:hypothetical protein M0805_006125 [Coniferiporia weirii]
MEKYSAFRDPGTGIQPFLSPVHPQGSESIAILLTPLSYLLGTIRTLSVLILSLVYLLVVQGVCILLSPAPPLYRLASNALTSILARLALFIVGIYWIPVEVVKRKKGRASYKEVWSPNAGDMIISNWVSWIEIAWLAFRFNPTFILPITAPAERVPTPSPSPSHITPGRKTGTGSAAIATPSRGRAQTKRADIIGFSEVSFLNMVMKCGNIPPYGSNAPDRSLLSPLSLDEVVTRAKKAGRPLALFPECTTSNGRGLLRFANLFEGVTVPVKDFNVFIMCVRIDPPTTFSPTISLPIPSSRLPVIPHVFSISSAILPHTLSIRLLAPSQSPSSGSFLLSELLPGHNGGDDVLSEVSAILISDMGRVKRTGMGWEDKAMFLEFYRGKNG